MIHNAKIYQSKVALEQVKRELKKQGAANVGGVRDKEVEQQKKVVLEAKEAYAKLKQDAEKVANERAKALEEGREVVTEETDQEDQMGLKVELERINNNSESVPGSAQIFKVGANKWIGILIIMIAPTTHVANDCSHSHRYLQSKFTTKCMAVNSSLHTGILYIACTHGDCEGAMPAGISAVVRINWFERALKSLKLQISEMPKDDRPSSLGVSESIGAGINKVLPHFAATLLTQIAIHNLQFNTASVCSWQSAFQLPKLSSCVTFFQVC